MLGFFYELRVISSLTFFVFRDGREVASRIECTLPLRVAHRAIFEAKFVAVMRTTIKGSPVLASQGIGLDTRLERLS